MRVPTQKQDLRREHQGRALDPICRFDQTNLLKVEKIQNPEVVFDNYKIQEDPRNPLAHATGEKSTITGKERSMDDRRVARPGQELVEDKPRR